MLRSPSNISNSPHSVKLRCWLIHPHQYPIWCIRQLHNSYSSNFSWCSKCCWWCPQHPCSISRSYQFSHSSTSSNFQFLNRTVESIHQLRTLTTTHNTINNTRYKTIKICNKPCSPCAWEVSAPTSGRKNGRKQGKSKSSMLSSASRHVCRTSRKYPLMVNKNSMLKRNFQGGKKPWNSLVNFLNRSQNKCRTKVISRSPVGQVLL